jgi:tetratricopeptide (TPR) repeat protein
MPAPPTRPEFRGTARHELVRRLGAGGYGVVFEAVDHDTGERVALKLLRDLQPEALYRFKREFRALADVRHGNLVRLRELFSADDQWYFTMELVEGVDFLRAVGATARLVDAGAAALTGAATQIGPPSPPIDGLGRTVLLTPAALATGSRGRGGPVGADPGRLRAALRQLADGVAALHRRGMLHRDLKPSNVLVTAAGRVVILDFGLVSELGQRGRERPDVAGTVEYMAPEQAAGLATTGACDWYSVGVMLFEALTGRLPFAGTILEVLAQKLERDPPPVRALAPDAPADLAALCMALLAPDPEERPDDDEVLALLGAAVPASTLVPGPTTPLVGREAELAALAGLADAVGEGRAVVALVHGGAGHGKSALLEHFLAARGRAEPAPVILEGRCHERERVPYKAVDGLVDALAHELRSRSAAEQARLCPPEVAGLARLFPVLRRVPAIDRAAAAPGDSRAAPHEQRAEAFAALRTVLTRLAAAAPVVLAIDDLQWGDVDSAALLRALLRPPDPPPLLLVACHRADVDAGGCVEALRELAGSDASLVRGEVGVGPLAPAAAEALARALLRGSPRADEAPALAREAGGLPLDLAELARFVREAPGEAIAEVASFEDVLRRRLAALDPAARALLAVVALAVQPIAPELASAVAGGVGDPAPRIAELRRVHLLRSLRADGRTRVEPFHERVRATVLADLDAARQAEVHRALAEALARAPEPDDEALMIHFEAAGEPARAARHALRAAARAHEALAFERAAALYRAAVAHLPAAEIPAARVRLGDALASDGRGAAAADAYEQAADLLPGDARLELLRLAGFERLRSGQIDEGVAVLQKVLASSGLRLAPTRTRAILSLAGHRVALALRGLRFHERPAEACPPELLRRADVAWSVGASGLGMVDEVAAGEFQSLSLRLSLRAGEPGRICRALAGEVAFSAVGGAATQGRTARLLHTARALAERLDDPHARGTVAMTAGVAAYLEGRFRDAADACGEAERLLRGRPGAAWDLINAQLFGLQARVYLGELTAVAARLGPLLREAEERGNLYVLASLRAGPTHLHWLAQDAVDEARAAVDEAARRWSTRGVQVQHYWQMHARCEFELYRGEPLAALALLERRWGGLAALRRIQFVRVESLYLRGRVLLACDRPELLPRVAADARAIARDGAPWGDALARLLRAGVAARLGDRALACVHLADAAAGFESAGMIVHTAAARLRRGELTAGPTGAALRERAATCLQGQGVRDLSRFVATLAPGFERPVL